MSDKWRDLCTDKIVSPTDAVRSYHEALAGQGILPQRELQEDLELTDRVLRAE